MASKSKSKNKKIIQVNDANGWCWVLLGVLANIIYLPTGIFTKIIVTDVEPSIYPVLRYGLAAIVLLPIVIYWTYKYRAVIKNNIKEIILICVLYGVSLSCYSMAISMCDLSFVAVLDMFSPIVFTIMSVLLIKDKISRNALIGLLFAILGGVMIFVLPLLIGTGSIIAFGWVPVILLTVSTIIPQLMTIFQRKWSEQGLPLLLVIGFGNISAVIVAIIFTLFSSGAEAFNSLSGLNMEGWMMVFYVGIMASVIARFTDVGVYKRVGTATQATLAYLYYCLAVILPIIILGERLSWEVTIGAGLVLIGIVFTRFNNKKNIGPRKRHKSQNKHITK